jgi:hypothetical protein
VHPLFGETFKKSLISAFFCGILRDMPQSTTQHVYPIFDEAEWELWRRHADFESQSTFERPFWQWKAAVDTATKEQLRSGIFLIPVPIYFEPFSEWAKEKGLSNSTEARKKYAAMKIDAANLHLV